jgi:hypothetical protein
VFEVCEGPFDCAAKRGSSTQNLRSTSSKYLSGFRGTEYEENAAAARVSSIAAMNYVCAYNEQQLKQPVNTIKQTSTRPSPTHEYD